MNNLLTKVLAIACIVATITGCVLSINVQKESDGSTLNVNQEANAAQENDSINLKVN